MLQWIISSSLRLRTVVISLAVVLLVGGIWHTRNVPLDLVPEFSPLSLEVQTEALGLSASEVESLITVPLEADLLNGVPWLHSIESESITGLSSIEMFFAPGTNLMQARQMVQERLTQAHALPNVSSPPVMLQPVSSASRIMNIGLSSKTVSLIEMSVQARWNIVPRLVGVPGVANVSVWGMHNRQVHVQVDPARLRAKGVTLEQIVKTAGESVWASPLTYLNSSTPGAGGFIDTPNQRLGVRHVSPTSSPESFAKVPVFGTSLPLQDVVRVVEDSQPQIGSAILKDGSGLLLVVEKFPGANTTQVTEGVEAALRELSPGMKGIEVDTKIYRPASFIERAARNLATGIVIAYLLVVIAVGLLLGSWRAALVAALVIPTSLLAAVWVFQAWGADINMLMVAGLMLAVAVIVDDAIIDVDHIARRLREARREDSQQPALDIIVRAALEVRGPMLYATAILLLAVLPALFMQGASAPFFQPLVWAYIVAVLASLAVALTLTPALSLLLLSSTSLPERTGSRVMMKMKSGSARLVDAALHTPLPAFALGAIGVVVGVLVWTNSERTYLPGFKETDVVVELEGSAGTSLPAMNRSAASVMKDLLALKGVRNAAAQVGRAVLSKEVADVNSAEVWVSIDPDADYEDTLEAMQQVVAGYPGLKGEVHTFLSKRMRETLTGDDETVSVRVYGHDQKIIQDKAEEIRDVLAKIDGISNPRVEAHAEKTTIEVKGDLDKARHFGLKPGDVRRAASTLMSGITVGALFEDQKVFDVIVVGSPDVRNNLSDMRNLLIDSPAGPQVRLGDIADVNTTASPGVIRRQGVSRRIDIEADVTGGDVSAVSREVARRIKEMPFPFEYHAQVLGEHFARQAALRSLYSYLLAAAALIFLLLQAAFGSWRLALFSLLGVPVAMLGGFLAVLAGDDGFTLGSMLGFGAVLGLSVRNTVLLVRHFQSLELHGEAFDAALVRRGMGERIPAVLISAITTAMLVLPFVVLGDVAGLEILHGSAVVILGGLVSTTLWLLVCIPALYLRFGARSAQGTLDVAAGSA
ncbi:efflux RND transporter permease subunit [Rhodoferax ferrireducens]|uniref:efflux RND transporter permease subunit n=1 Tax=Rhodoferax ferrireducens TaxID=192843 RepID=UPI000E0D68B8|nr:efflux RND transporter permease subunit [Rhodoferax ferrireducens]